MRKLTTHIIIAMLAITALGSCTHNDGDIGPWFGQWHLDSIEIDGVPDTNYDGNFYFMFQDKIFALSWVDEENHIYYDSFAQWQENDGGTTMTVNFLDPRYSPRINTDLPDIHLKTITKFNVINLKNDTMLLEHIDPDTGTAYRYHLTLWR